MQLQKILSGVNVEEIKGEKNVDISSITDDSRKITKGSLFIAVPGLRSDGHAFIDSAVSSGAVAVVCEKIPDRLHQGVCYVKVADSRDAMGTIASNYFGSPSKKLILIGVTGTKGKTTTCFMIYHILNNAGFKTGLITSIAAKIGSKTIDTGFHVTNPDVISLNKLLKAMVEEKCEFAVIEVSSHGIHQKRIAGLDFEITALTNIAPEHLDYHKTFEEYKRVKMYFVNSGRYKVISPKMTKLNIVEGDFNNLDAETAVRVCELAGVKREESQKILKNFTLPEGRLEHVDKGQPFKLIIDFAHTPQSLESALRYVRKITKGKIISVFGSAGERDPYKRPEMGRISTQIADVSVVTAEDPRSEDVNKIITEICAGAEEAGAEEINKKKLPDIKPGKASYFIKIPDRDEAIGYAISIAREGDTVCLFGKGHEKSMNLDGVNELPWSDRETSEKYLGANSKNG